MFDAETTALLQAVLDKVCENVAKYETGARTHVASKILKAATRGGETSVEGLSGSARPRSAPLPRCGADRAAR